jgi:hypothetical protein
MLVLTAAALILAPAQAPTASEAVTKMLTKYHNAQSISGRVTFTQSAAGARVVISTDLFSRKPNMLFVQQIRTPASQGGANNVVAMSDGKKVGYPAPAGAGTFLSESPQRFFEPAKPDLEGNFSMFSGMLIDRSLPVAIGLYSPNEVAVTIGRLRDLKLSEIALGEKTIYRIDFQLVIGNALPADPSRGLPARPEARVAGVMTVSKEFDLLGLAWKETVGTKEQQVEILSEWVADLQVDKSIDQNVFKVR